jgi:PKD repeat protein
MGDNFAIKYIKSNKTRPGLLILALIVFISILFHASVVASAVDVTLAWDPPDTWQPDGYKIYCKVGSEPSKSSYDRQIEILRGDLTDPDNPQWIVDNVSDTETTFFAATAYEVGGDESGFSNIESYNGGGANQPPTASFTATPSSGDAPLDVAFDGSASSDTDGTIASYDWDFGDGTSSTAVSPSHTYGSAGDFTVTLTVTDNDGATDSASTLIQVTTPPAPNQPPTASFTATPSSGDAPLDVTFDGSASSDPDGSIVSYDWDFGDGSVGTGVNPSYTYTDVGNYTVTLTVTDDGIPAESDSTSMTITVTDPAVTNLPPDKPVISSPYSGEMETDILLSINSEPFSDPDGDAHSMSQWQIIKQSDSSVVLEIMTSEHLTKIPVPHAVLDREATYSASVQFYDSYSEPSEWSDPVEFTTITDVVDLDDDGIPDDQEVDDTVDLNEDGTPDNDQPDVIKSAHSAVAGKKPLGVCKIAADVDGIVMLEPIHPSEILDKKNKPKKFLYGLAAYRLQVPQQGGTVQVTVYYAEDISGANRYFLYDRVNGWQDYTQYTTFNPDGRSLTVELKDGGHGDSDGVANGIIVDPGGVTDGVIAASAGDSGAGGGCFIATAKHTERHDWLEPIVRILLMPLVGLLLIMSLFSFCTLICRRRTPRA